MQKAVVTFLKKSLFPPMVCRRRIRLCRLGRIRSHRPRPRLTADDIPRYRFSVPLTIRSTDGEITRAITLEISASGVSAITERSLRLNDTVELEPIAASKVLAVVRRNVGRIYGFEFLALSSEQAHTIVERCKLLPRYLGKSLGI